jgi:hypothetical protein
VSAKKANLAKELLEEAGVHVRCGTTTPARLTNLDHFLELPTMRPSLSSSSKVPTMFSSAIHDAEVGIALRNAPDGASHVVLCNSSRVRLPSPPIIEAGYHLLFTVSTATKKSAEKGARSANRAGLEIDDGRLGPDII